MYEGLGYQWASFLAGMLALALSLTPFILMRFGPSIRAKVRKPLHPYFFAIVLTAELAHLSIRVNSPRSSPACKRTRLETVLAEGYLTHSRHS